MMNYIPTFLCIAFLLFVIIFARKNEREQMIRQHFRKKKVNAKRRTVMKELAQRFIGKECIIYLFSSQVEATIVEATEGGIVIERNGQQEVINYDFIVRIREYPLDKNGKKKSFVVD